jgi:hypothetical protein
MPAIDRQQLDHLERRGFQLTIFSAIFVFILAGGLATFMYPLVFLHPEGNRWELGAAFFGFCALTILFIGYLFDRQRSFTKIKQQLLSELERNVELQVQASADLLKSMPNQDHFWDRLTMEFRRAHNMEKNLSLVLVKAKPSPGLRPTAGKPLSATLPRRCPKNCAPPIPSTGLPTISSAWFSRRPIV